ncbi:MAG: hypothetical protein IIW48_11290 [Clostridia bacterium]|nr:hypothetical protein [Clostridia bacterium]
MKKIIALLTAAAMLLSFAACGKTETPDTTQAPDPTTTEAVTQNADVQTTDIQQTQAQQTDVQQSDTPETEPQHTQQTQQTQPPKTQTTVERETSTVTHTTPSTTVTSTDPSKWTKAQIIEHYKSAASKSKSVKSQKKMVLGEFVVNDGDGLLAAFVEMVLPLFKSTLEENSTEFDGITGGYEKLVPSDVKTAKAYKSGNYTVIEMTMYEQVDGIHGNENEGTVGHAISVVGDISVVQEKLPMFYIDFENSDLTIRYANPVLKVKINNTTGKIEKGTWSYDVMVNLKNLYIKNLRLPIELTVRSGHGSVAFNVTVGGGF